MLRFFRKYNKIILAVFGTLLMVVFTIQIPLEQCTPSPQDLALGTANGRELTRGDLTTAQVQLQVLSRLHLSLLVASRGEPITWLFMKEEAQAMGLSASQRQVDEVLALLNLSDETVAAAARSMQVSRDFLREAIRTWAVVDSYRSLVHGFAHLSVPDRLQRYALMAQSGWGGETFAYGDPYLSRPRAEWYVGAVQSQVKIRSVLIPYLKHLGEIGEPDEQTARELFERYKEVSAGEGKPFRFGYRLPDRVRVEYVTLRMEEVQDTVEVTDREAVDYYHQHPEYFQAAGSQAQPGLSAAEGAPAAVTTPQTVPIAGPDGSGVRPYSQVRGEAHDRVRRQKAQQRADQIIEAVRDMLMKQIHGLPSAGAYRAVPDAFEPIPFSRVQQSIRERFATELDWVPDDGRWLARLDLELLAGIGGGVVAVPGRGDSGRERSFADYALSSRELESDDAVLGKLRLQLKCPSNALRGGTARYVFRLTAVSRAQTPDFETVRDRVLRDAKTQAAYERLLEQKDAWLGRTKSSTLDALAAELNTVVNESAPFPRRRHGVLGLQAPLVAGIGRDETFVDRVFDMIPRDMLEEADASAKQGTGRIVAVSVDAQLSLCLVQYQEFKPLTRSGFEQLVNSDPFGEAVNLRPVAMLARSFLGDFPSRDPLALDAVQARLNFTSEP